MIERDVANGLSAQVVGPVAVTSGRAMVESGEEGELSAEWFERGEGSRGFEVNSGFDGIKSGGVESEVSADANEAFRLCVGVFGPGFRFVGVKADGLQKGEGEERSGRGEKVSA